MIQRDIWDNRGNCKRILDIFWVVDERQVFVCKLIGKKELFYKGDENYLLIYVYHDQTYNLDNGTQVDTLLSNDSGVAFIVKTKEGTIYHAGDLNDWYWDGEPKADNQRLTSAYRAEIRKIKGMHFDAAFVPLDPRQGNHYADGILYFLKNVDCNVIFPMHYWNDANVIKRFITEYPQYKSRIKNTECAKGEEL